MKKQSILLAMLALVLAFGLASVSCENEPSKKIENDEGELLVNQPSIDDGGTFNAKILEIRNNTFIDDYYFLVEPLEGEAIRSIADRISFVSRFFDKTGVSVGDYITIRYDGFVEKSYPARIVVTGWALSQATAEPKSIRITDISDATTIVRVGVYLFTELPTILSLPLPVAVGYGDNPGGGSASLIYLTVPLDGGGIFDGPPGRETGPIMSRWRLIAAQWFISRVAEKLR
jgi:hypothetical protein